jgi:hypothetical protein
MMIALFQNGEVQAARSTARWEQQPAMEGSGNHRTME